MGWTATAHAQTQVTPLRYGFGFNLVLSGQEGLGLGFVGRASYPMNADLSFAGELGFSGFVLDGRDGAAYALQPQAMAIITLPFVNDSAPYLITGVGGFIVTNPNNDSISGPTVHLGLGWVRPLVDTTLFYEINPAIVLGSDAVGVAIPFRVGFIF
ncbi:MAG: hypothetical protein RhofKO_10420 [Rhodothermales bacterium]